MGAPPRSPLHCGNWNAIGRCGEAWRRLRRQDEVELLHQELLIRIELGVATENQRTTVSRREVHVEHLYDGHFVEHSPGSETGCQWLKPRTQGYVQAVGEEGDEDMGFDALLELVVDGA